jgi:hypothetical protein
MPHSLTISDGTTTVSLTTSTTAFLLDYEPSTPNITQQEAISAIVDGGELTSATQRNVTESARVLIVGASGAAVQTTVRTIERLLRQAEERQRLKGGPARVYVNVQMDSDANVWRSEILSGSVTLADRVWEEWSNKQAEIVITWARRFYWEEGESYVALYDPVLDSTTTELTIVNHSNGSNRNHAQIPAASVGGSLPAACRIELKNTTGSTLNYNNVYIGYARWTNGASWAHMLEGENNEQSGGTDTAEAGSSGGNYHLRTWTPNVSYSSIQYIFTITGTQLGHANGGYFRLLARFTNNPNATTYVKTQVRSQGVNILFETPEVKLKAQQLQDLGVIQLPPSLSQLPSYALSNLALYMFARNTAAGSMSIDYIQLTPLDGWRHLNVVGTSFANNTIVIDDGMAGITYTQEPGVGAQGNIVSLGQPILLWPGVAQRLYFLFDEDNGNSVISRQQSVRVAYRQRRLTI